MIEPARSSNGRLGWRLFALSFAALFLELMLIRWVPSVIRLVAYYANLMLISSFLGLGLGAMLARRRWNPAVWLLPLLAVEVAFVLICRYFAMRGGGLAMPGAEHEARFFENNPELANYLVLVGMFVINTATFVPLGAMIGRIFHELPTLRAYSWDLGGSLFGTLAFGAFSLLLFSPVVGVGLVVAIALLLLALDGGRKFVIPGAVLGGGVLVAVAMATRPDAVWSPYHYVLIDRDGKPAGEPPPDVRTMRDPPTYNVRVNQDIYQGNLTLNPSRYTGGELPAGYRGVAVQYGLPHRIKPGAKRVLVLGAGGGVDVEAALLAGATHVDAVEIDPALVRLSRRYNASGVYDDPRVTVHVDDARAFMQRSKGGYDMIVFGFLDSQALFSYGKSVRLDGFVYTIESFRRAFALLAPDGMLSVSFSAPREWVWVKIVEMIRDATGSRPIAYLYTESMIVLAPKAQMPAPPAEVTPFKLTAVPFANIARATDDWPYLYLFSKVIPRDYVVVISTLIVLSLAAVVALRGRQMGAEDAHFFFLGLGFLLLQAKSIGDCSLYFGATWLVTTIVITGVLLMVLLANLVAIRLKRPSLAWYVPLLATLVLLLLTPREAILALPYGARLAWALVAVPLPVFFAGLIFSTTFREAKVPSAVFGANLIGATVGGFAEYLGMAIGTHALWWIVIAAYAGSFVCRLRAGRVAALTGPSHFAETVSA